MEKSYPSGDYVDYADTIVHEQKRGKLFLRMANRSITNTEQPTIQMHGLGNRLM